MFELLKNFATQQLMSKMMSNSLSEADTGAAASEGASALLSSLTKGGDMSAITGLLSGAGGAGSNGLMQNVQDQLKGILQSKGMSAEEAETEASNVAPDLISGLQQKFSSQAEEDKGFDIGDIAGLLGGGGSGGAGDLLNAAKNLFGK